MFPSAPPPNHHVQFALKSSVWFTPPEIAKSDLPSNRQVRFTPQIVCTIYPPQSQSPINPQIAKSDLPLKSSVRFTPPPEIAKSDLPSNRQVRFTPQIVCTIYPPPKRPFLSKISNAHNIMLCFTKVFSAKDQ